MSNQELDTKLIYTWYGRQGDKYSVYRDRYGNISCNCPCCINDGECWQVAFQKGHEFYRQMLALKVKSEPKDTVTEARLFTLKADFMKHFKAGNLKLIGVNWVRTDLENNFAKLENDVK